VQEAEPICILAGSKVTLIRQGDVHAEVLFMSNQSKLGIQRLSKDEYVVLASGEVKQFKPAEGKMREALRRTFQELKALIRTNFSADDPYQKFITLTYRGADMTDRERLYADFKKFMMRLKEHCKGHQLEYIVVAEPHASGGWHMHLMLKSMVMGLWIDKDKLTEIWGHGYTEIAQLKSDDVGQYYVHYFTSLQAEAKDLRNGVADPEAGSKAYIKGGRLQYYPQGFRFYRCSRGIRRPTREEIMYWKVQNEYGKPKRQRAIKLVVKDEAAGTEDCINHIQREAFRRRE